MNTTIWRQRRRGNALIGIALGGIAVGIFTWSIVSLKQDDLADVPSGPGQLPAGKKTTSN
jgi:hypothetical protein